MSVRTTELSAGTPESHLCSLRDKENGLGNQQERTLGLAFIGGLVTGEGSFCLTVRRRKERHGGLTISPVFALFMSDFETIDFLSEALRGLGLPVYVQERPKAGRGQIGIHISGLRRVRRYCQLLIPFLTGQKLQAAELTLAFIESRLAKDKGVPYSDDELDIVRRLREVNGNTNGKKNPL